MSEYGEISDRAWFITSSSCDAGKRADAFIAEKTGLTRSAVAKLMEKGNVLLGDTPAPPQAGHRRPPSPAPALIHRFSASW